MSETVELKPVVQRRLVRDCWRCSRCGETPRRGVHKILQQRGLTCACRHYVVSRATWWRMAALRERLWVDWNGNAEELNRRYWSMPESGRVVYARIPNTPISGGIPSAASPSSQPQ